MNALERLKHELFQLVKMDYGFEIYNVNDTVIKFSFYHLGSVYNAFCTSVFYNGEWGEASINWQYAKSNKAAARHAAAVVDCLVRLHGTADDLAEKEVEYYKALSDQIFNAKYSTAVELHTWTGGDRP